jgi:hypothetical protein
MLASSSTGTYLLRRIGETYRYRQNVSPIPVDAAGEPVDGRA